MLKFNPFQPGTIVNPTMFSGRSSELFAIEKILFQTTNGNPSHFVVHGERGIGKSSLLLYLDHLARGDITSPRKQRYTFATVHIHLENNYSHITLITTLCREVSAALRRCTPLRTFLKEALDAVSRLEAFSVKYNHRDDAETPCSLFVEFCEVVTRAAKQIKGHCDGLLLLIDECDKAGEETHLGEFAKMFTEHMSRNGITNVVLGLAGLSSVIEKLRKSHESSVRVFRQFELLPLSTEEASHLVAKGIAAANTQCTSRISIDDRVVQWIAGHGSQGFPHFVQEYAHATFDADTDNRIDGRDLFSGVYGANGALNQLGKKYFENMYIDQIASNDYRHVLKAMAIHLDGFVTKAQLRQRAGLKESTLNNAITALKQRNIILAKKGMRGVYRLPSKSFAVWIRTFTSERLQLARPPEDETAIAAALAVAHDAFTHVHEFLEDEDEFEPEQNAS